MLVTELDKYYIWKDMKRYRFIIRIPRLFVKIYGMKAKDVKEVYRI